MTTPNLKEDKVIPKPDSTSVSPIADRVVPIISHTSRDGDHFDSGKGVIIKIGDDSSNKWGDLAMGLKESSEIIDRVCDPSCRKELGRVDSGMAKFGEISVSRDLRLQEKKVFQNHYICRRYDHYRASRMIMCSPLVRRDRDRDRGPSTINWLPPERFYHKSVQPVSIHIHLAMDPAKESEIRDGKRQTVEEEVSSAAENCTPQNKLMRDAMKGGNQEKPARKFKPRVTAAALSQALEEATVGDEDAIVVDFDEVKENMQPFLVAIGRYVTTQLYSIRGLFVRMRQIWQLRGGMV
jgi:hypothetical protein